MQKNKRLPTIVKDTREHDGHGFNFRASASCSGMIREKIDAGDYGIKEYPDLIVIERKQSVTELCGNFGKNRKRFERELERMEDITFKYIVIEDYWSSVKKPKYTKMRYAAILGSIVSIELKYGIHFIFAGNAKMAQDISRSLLIKAWKYREEGIV